MFCKSPSTRYLLSVSMVIAMLLVSFWVQPAALANACGTLSFQPAQNFTVAFGPQPFNHVSSQPYQIAVADFDRDGKPDMAVTTSPCEEVSPGVTLCGVGPTSVEIFLGDGVGNFTLHTILPAGGHFAFPPVTTGDFNGDGNPDLAAGGDGQAWIYLGDGTGGFSPATTFPCGGSQPIRIAVSDFNRDHKPDLAVANFLEFNVSVLLGNGAGGFSAPVSIQLGGGNEDTLPYGIAVSDFNSDSNPDLAVSNGNWLAGYEVKILLGDGLGNFPTVVTLPAGHDVAAGDFNHDGKSDLAGAGGASVLVNFGDGTGAFSAPPYIFDWDVALTDYISLIDYLPLLDKHTAAGDFNGDGNLDVAVSDSRGIKISVMLGSGDGSFSTPIDFTVGSNPIGVAVGDFNLDGKPDMAVPNYLDGTVSVLLNSSSSCPPTNKEQCKKGGWQTFNTPRAFKNQGDCIQFVNTGK